MNLPKAEFVLLRCSGFVGYLEITFVTARRTDNFCRTGFGNKVGNNRAEDRRFLTKTTTGKSLTIPFFGCRGALRAFGRVAKDSDSDPSFPRGLLLRPGPRVLIESNVTMCGVQMSMAKESHR